MILKGKDGKRNEDTLKGRYEWEKVTVCISRSQTRPMSSHVVHRLLCFLLLIMFFVIPSVLPKKKTQSVILISSGGGGGGGGGGGDYGSGSGGGGYESGSGGASANRLIMDAQMGVQENDILIIGGGSGSGSTAMATIIEQDKKTKKMEKLKKMKKLMQSMAKDKKSKKKGPIIIIVPDKEPESGAACGGACSQDSGKESYGGQSDAVAYDSMSMDTIMPMMYPPIMMMPPIMPPAPMPPAPQYRSPMPDYGAAGGSGDGGYAAASTQRDMSGMMMAMMTELKMARMMSKLERMLDD